MDDGLFRDFPKPPLAVVGLQEQQGATHTPGFRRVLKFYTEMEINRMHVVSIFDDREPTS